VSRCQKKLLLDFMVLGRITRGAHTDNPGGRHSIWTNQQSTSINPPFLHRMPFLPQPSQFILAWERHRNMLNCIPPWLIFYFNQQPPHHNRFTALFRDHPGQPVPKENFGTSWCKGRLTEADKLTIWLGATPSELTSAHLHHPPIF